MELNGLDPCVNDGVDGVEMVPAEPVIPLSNAFECERLDTEPSNGRRYDPVYDGLLAMYELDEYVRPVEYC